MPLPYPKPTSAVASRIMRANRKVGTRPEVLLRSLLHRRGLRYRKLAVIHAGALTVRPDVTFPARRVAAFLDGCFWHCCPEHGSSPASNTDYWLPKLRRNVERDRLVDDALAAEGWTVVRIWEHELRLAADAAVTRVEEALTGAG